MNAELGMDLSGKVLDCSIASDNFVGHEDRIERSGSKSRGGVSDGSSVHRPTTTYRPADHLGTALHWLPQVGREAVHRAQDRRRATGPRVDPAPWRAALKSGEQPVHHRQSSAPGDELLSGKVGKVTLGPLVPSHS